MNAVLRSPNPFAPLPGRELAEAARRHLPRALAAGSLAWALLFAAAVAMVAMRVHPRIIDVLPKLPPSHALLTGSVIQPPPSIVPPAVNPPAVRVRPPDVPAVVEPVRDENATLRTLDTRAATGAPPGSGTRTGEPDQSGITGVAPARPPLPLENEYTIRDEEPVPLFAPRPVYPDLASKAQVDGTVIVHALVDVDGSVVKATIVRSIPLLDGAAIEAIRHWRFRPAMSGGHPVAVWVAVPVRFTLH